MSANDVMDVLNIQREDVAQPAKKKQRVELVLPPKGGINRELYNLLGPNTPAVNITLNRIRDRKSKVSPWTLMPFQANKRGKGANAPVFHHWEKGSRTLLELEGDRPYSFDKFMVLLDLPQLVDRDTYVQLYREILIEEKKAELIEKEKKQKEEEEKEATEKENKEKPEVKEETSDPVPEAQSQEPQPEPDVEEALETGWTYEETECLFELCNVFELKWAVIFDRFPLSRTIEELKEHFYKLCAKILKRLETGNPHLIDALASYSRKAEVERKRYLESLLKRTPAEIAEEESLVIEARRFELAAKKMLMERLHLLTLLDLPQASLSVQQYQLSSGLTSLYNNLMIMDKQKKRQREYSQDPVPPPIPAALLAFKRDKGFQTHLQQYLNGLLRQQGGHMRSESSAIQKLLAKRLTTKEEEAYGLHYHATERLTPGVTLRSQQKLPGLQQRQSVFKSMNALLQELDIPTVGGTLWKPNMPTRNTMAKYDELIRTVVLLLDVKKGRDKLEAEVELIRSQRGYP